MKNPILAASFLTLSVMTSIQMAYAEEKFSLATGMDYSSGKYGGTQSTNMVYVPVTGKYQGKAWTLKLTVPYLQISGPSNVVKGVGQTGAAAANTRSTRSGLGDVIVAASHNAYNGGASGLMVNLTGKVKFGTASNAKGLGTGKNDYALQADMYHTVGKLTTFGHLGYRVNASPAAYRLNNVFYGLLGGSYKFNQETNGGLMLNMSQKTTVTGSSHTEALLFISHKIDQTWKAQGYALKGFTNSVPDFGVGVTVSYLL